MDKTIRKNKGLTLIGFLIVLVVALFFAYAGMRVVPMYLEYQALIGAMNKLEGDPGSKSMPPNKIKENIRNSLWVSYAANNIKTEHIHVSKTSGGIMVRVAYEVREDFLGNLDIIASFDRSVVLR